MRKVIRKGEPQEEVVLDDGDIEPPFDTAKQTPDEQADEIFGPERFPEGEKGRLTQITYKTNKNLGNMQHESVELTSTVGTTEDVETVFNYLKETAEYLLDAGE